jgi:hypothetical protein
LVSHIKGRITTERCKTSVLTKTFRPEKVEALRARRNVHNEELHKLHLSSKINRVKSSNRLVGRSAHMEEKRNTYVVLVGKK